MYTHVAAQQAAEAGAGQCITCCVSPGRSACFSSPAEHMHVSTEQVHTKLDSKLLKQLLDKQSPVMVCLAVCLPAFLLLQST
jgi:hypothetical protein